MSVGLKKEPLPKSTLVRETLPDGGVYEYRALGRHIVSAPGVCRGRPTFKYTRIEVAGVLEWLGAGNPADQLIVRYGGRVTREALQEAAALAGAALVRQVVRRANS